MIRKIWRKRNSTPNCKNEEAAFEILYHLFDKLFTLNRIMIYEMYRIFLFCSSANRYIYILEYVSYKGCNLTWIPVDVWRYVCTYIIEIVQKSHKYTCFSDRTTIVQDIICIFLSATRIVHTKRNINWKLKQIKCTFVIFTKILIIFLIARYPSNHLYNLLVRYLIVCLYNHWY